jgi:hypothetical protein
MAIKIVKGDLENLNLTFEINQKGDAVCLFSITDDLAEIPIGKAIEELKSLLKILEKD